MNYTFTVDTLIPKSEFMSVTYRADGYPDYRRNFNPTSFTESDLSQIVTDFAPHVVDFWERWDSHPETVTFTGGSGTAEAPVVAVIDPTHVTIIEDQPDYDPFTQKISLDEITDFMQETVGWTVTDMGVDSQADFLTEWRESFTVSMAQFRLALRDRALDSAETTFSTGDTTTQLLWQSSDFVARNSQRVQNVMSALSLTDSDLDEFFLHAGTLDITL